MLRCKSLQPQRRIWLIVLRTWTFPKHYLNCGRKLIHLASFRLESGRMWFYFHLKCLERKRLMRLVSLMGGKQSDQNFKHAQSSSVHDGRESKWVSVKLTSELPILFPFYQWMSNVFTPKLKDIQKKINSGDAANGRSNVSGTFTLWIKMSPSQKHGNHITCWIFSIFLKCISFTFSHINMEILKWFAQNFRIRLEVIPDNQKKNTFLVQAAASISQCDL